ncbi:RWP-RK domain-containing protein [Balamuthia mandrillaris]
MMTSIQAPASMHNHPIARGYSLLLSPFYAAAHENQQNQQNRRKSSVPATSSSTTASSSSKLQSSGNNGMASSSSTVSSAAATTSSTLASTATPALSPSFSFPPPPSASTTTHPPLQPKPPALRSSSAAASSSAASASTSSASLSSLQPSPSASTMVTVTTATQLTRKSPPVVSQVPLPLAQASSSYSSASASSFSTTKSLPQLVAGKVSVVVKEKHASVGAEPTNLADAENLQQQRKKSFLLLNNNNNNNNNNQLLNNFNNKETSGKGIKLASFPKQLQELECYLQREVQLLDQLKALYKLPVTANATALATDEYASMQRVLKLKQLGCELQLIHRSKEASLDDLLLSLSAASSGKSDTKRTNEQESEGMATEQKESALRSKVAEEHTEEMDAVLATEGKQIPLSPDQLAIRIVQQPAEVATANRYLSPPPALAVPFAASAGMFLIARARLFYHLTGEEVITTAQGNQDILQGIKQITVNTKGRAVFTKLKVMDVSSKHKHQSFCVVFSVEEYSAHGFVRTLATAKTTPFHVASRPTSQKRKNSGKDSAEEEQKDEDVGTSTSMAEPVPDVSSLSSLSSSRELILRFTEVSPPSPSSSSSSSSSFTSSSSWTSETPYQQPLQQNNTNSSSFSKAPTQDSTNNSNNNCLSGTKRKQPERMSAEINYIDITDLLTLPQKEAARRLGISESMLCKRFKECTRRKWPYRYLRKIDKIIGMLKLHSADGLVLDEDKEKLSRLRKEREDCLRPVRIRITSLDRLPAPMKHRTECLDHQTSDANEEDEEEEEELEEEEEEEEEDVKHRRQRKHNRRHSLMNGSSNNSHHRRHGNEFVEEEDIPFAALESLEMLKRQRVSSSLSSSPSSSSPSSPTATTVHTSLSPSSSSFSVSSLSETNKTNKKTSSSLSSPLSCSAPAIISTATPHHNGNENQLTTIRVEAPLLPSSSSSTSSLSYSSSCSDLLSLLMPTSKEKDQRRRTMMALLAEMDLEREQMLRVSDDPEEDADDDANSNSNNTEEEDNVSSYRQPLPSTPPQQTSRGDADSFLSTTNSQRHHQLGSSPSLLLSFARSASASAANHHQSKALKKRQKKRTNE